MDKLTKKPTAKRTEENFYSLKPEMIFKIINSSPEGLSSEEAKKRLMKNGPNILAQEKPYSRLKIFFSQFKNPLIYILLGGGAISLIIGEHIDAQVIAATVMINVIISFIQEDKANSALNKLKKIVEHQAYVRRDGKEIEIPAAEIVAGDILILKAGKIISADARVFEDFDLEVNEASLTGESLAVSKSILPSAPQTGLADRKSMVYAGTNIISGHGHAVVVTTGFMTEVGKIAKMVEKADSGPTPLQEKLNGISRWLGLSVVVICLIIVLTGILKGISFLTILLAAIAISAAAIPEGLSVAVTVILAIGMKHLVKKKALVRKLLAAETLGSITAICSDKTGTLTEGKMRLEEIVSFSGRLAPAKLEGRGDLSKLKDFMIALKTGVLCNNAIIDPETTKSSGLALEVSFLRVALDLGVSQSELMKDEPRLSELPFNSDRKFMISLHKKGNAFSLYEKGAGEIILEKCVFLEDAGRIRKLESSDKKKISALYDELTLGGLRVIALAYADLKSLPFDPAAEDKNWNLVDKNLTFVGLAAFKDPLRHEAKKTIALCKKAGIRPIIITGDHPNTAQAIASELKMDLGATGVISGEFLEKINDSELAELVKTATVYARVSPNHKLRIVNALKKNREVVAMTGDGLNDSPALKTADIGICLGSGTEVAKETADIVLLDDNFSVIVSAIRQGRIIFDNIRKSLTYLIADCFSEIILIMGSIIFNMPLALLPTQILWINILNDGFPSLSMAFETNDDGVMARRPIKRNESIFNKEMKALLFGVGFVREALLFAGYYYCATHLGILGWSLAYLRTLLIAILVFKSITAIFSLRSFTLPIHKIKQFTNPYLYAAISLSAALLAAAVYWPALNGLLKTEPLAASSWIIVAAVSAVNILMLETVKAWFVHKKNKNN
ncbi:MAG: cation-translocating P-type ATPase [Patescibacteria group bacterium]|jgi:Ca2+-transporting ATPase